MLHYCDQYGQVAAPSAEYRQNSLFYLFCLYSPLVTEKKNNWVLCMNNGQAADERQADTESGTGEASGTGKAR